MEPYIFKSLASYLRRKELIKDTRLKVEEKLAFFLYMLSHNSSYEDMQLEFRHSGSTFHEYINEFFDIIPALCTRFVEPPRIDEPHPVIATDERFYPYFKVLSMKPKKEKRKNSGDVIAGALEKYIELKKRQVDDEATYLANEKADATKLHEFSITKCMDVLKKMEDVTRVEKIKAFNVFKDAANREIFINAADDDKDTAVMWLRSQMSP
uniref:DUF8040 domain-containing protein n=1 Tax=Hordeum vulgare subsp. vulgare TaxID=112509 RepID=A0A8I6YQ30_HORVV